MPGGGAATDDHTVAVAPNVEVDRRRDVQGRRYSYSSAGLGGARVATTGPSLTENQVLALIRAFLMSNLPDNVEVSTGQLNRVSEPTSDNFITMIPAFRGRISTTVDTWDNNAAATKMYHKESVQMEIQLDVHGENSTDNAQVIANLFRTIYACDSLEGTGIQPLHCDDGKQMPFINGENQYEDRWVMNLVVQGNITVTTDQQFANTLTPDLVNVESTYAP